MKVLFVSSGNSVFGISPIIFNQGESLKMNGVDVSYFTVVGKGFTGYFKNIIRLNRYLRSNNFDLIHAHYSLSSFVASLASAMIKVPIVTSLMGSDSKVNGIGKSFIKFFNAFFWERVIVKSSSMKEELKLKKALIIPNGVDFEKFKPIDNIVAKEKVGFSINSNKKIVSFLANPKRYSKNFQLAEQAILKLGDDRVELNVTFNVPPEDIVYYINASDVVLLTSRWEGSPNIIKETMACNIPIVSTEVGDVKQQINGVAGCFIAASTPEDVAVKIEKALLFNSRTNGRDSIKHLDVNETAKNIISIYKEILDEKK